MRKMLVTGGAGFIGANFIRHILSTEDDVVIINLDALTYAGSLDNLSDLPDPARHIFVEGDICDEPLVVDILRSHDIEIIVHFAAESHVDRSITGPAPFIQTNLVGTFTLLDAARCYWFEDRGLNSSSYRFHHISTDEVYGTLGPADP